jgi:tRNA uridine 5-carboxymethylaminomethyl modification enzyme
LFEQPPLADGGHDSRTDCISIRSHAAQLQCQKMTGLGGGVRKQRSGRIESMHARMSATKPDPSHAFFTSRGLELKDHRPSIAALLRRPEIHLADLIKEGVLDSENLRAEDVVSIETAIKYEGYLKQQEREVEKLRKAEAKRIPHDLDYALMPGLSREIIEKLSRVRPTSIAQASRIPGVTPASISILLFHIEMRRLSDHPESVV